MIGVSERKRFVRSVLAFMFLAMVSECSVGKEIDGKRVVLLGDSNTWLGGEDCSDRRGWSYWFAAEGSPLEIRSYARSGATWTHTEATEVDVDSYTEVIDDNNVIFNQVIRLSNDVEQNLLPVPDVIIIAAGTNDAWFADRRPEEFSTTVEQALGRDRLEYLILQPGVVRSLAESVVLDLVLLNSAFPEAMLIVLTPPPSTKISPPMLEKVSSIIAGAAEGMSAGLVRLDLLSPINPEKEAVNRRFTRDGVHTSEEGARKHGRIVARAVDELLKP